ncbi:MAG: glycosyltransferase family 2 protein [Chitinophagaceae bacterium]
MKVTGFTFIKNAIKFDYPIKEAILSIMPLCDEIIVAVGDCTDGTRELVAAIHPTKIKIIDTVWDTTKNTGGIVLADETNKAMAAISADTDWCFYIQGDEVFHEDGIDNVKAAMLKFKNDKNVDGLLFKYLHFYGSYDYIGSSVNWYRNEIRIIKNDKNIYSYKDAQGFRKGKDEKLKVKIIDAFICHYGWVKAPEIMQKKINGTAKFWGGDDVEDEKNRHKKYDTTFDYSQINALEKYTGKHPVLMQQRIEKLNWKFNYDVSYSNYSLKEKFKLLLFKLTGKMFFEYQNYRIV